MTSQTSINLDEILALAKKAGQLAAEEIRKVRASQDLGVKFKGTRDLVTSADLAAEKVILACIRERFPDHFILSEESSVTLTYEQLRGPLWVVDPVDGTTNFAHGHHQVAVSIAFCNKGEAQVGLVHAPFLAEEFHAIRGRGALLNDAPIKCREPHPIEACLVATGFPYSRDPEELAEIVGRLSRIISSCRDIRRLGSAALDISWVACGRVDGFYESLQPWDMAAACLIAREAGARVGHFKLARPNQIFPDELYAQDLVVAGPYLFDEMIKILGK